MSHDAAGSEPVMPIMPQRSARRSEDVPQGLPESLEPRRHWRPSEQPASSRAGIPSPGLPRSSDDVPTHQQLTHWQPIGEQPSSTPLRPAMQLQSNSNDYTVYEEAEPAATGNYITGPSGVSRTPSHATDPYGPRPYRRYVPRESTDMYRPLASEQRHRRQPSAQPQWVEGFYEEQSQPRGTPQKLAGGAYHVRAGGYAGGGGGGYGSPPPEQPMRLPFVNWLKGKGRGRKSEQSHTFISLRHQLTTTRLHCGAWRIRWHHYVPLLRLCGHIGRKHEHCRQCSTKYDQRHKQFQPHCEPLCCGCLWVFAHGQRLDLFSSQRRSLQ